MGALPEIRWSFGCLPDELLPAHLPHCGISLIDCVSNVNLLERCNTLPVESQLHSKRVIDNVLRMPNDGLPKTLLFAIGQVNVMPRAP